MALYKLSAIKQYRIDRGISMVATSFYNYCNFWRFSESVAFLTDPY